MLTQQKYLLALTISHIVSSLMVINEIHSKLQYQMNIYIFLPVAILIATSIAYKYVQSMLIYVASFTVLAICSFIFWSNETIIKEVFLHKPSYGCIIYLVIMIISAIVMPFTSPNSIFGIRIPQTEDYPEVWHRAHVFTSALLSLMILPTIIVIFHMEPRYSFVLCNIFLLVSLIIGIVYAVIIAIPIEKAEKMQIAKELEEQIMRDLAQPYVQGLTLLGGEPFLNTGILLPLVKRIREELPEKDIWSWTGYTWEELRLETPDKLELLQLVDILVDGRFDITKKNLMLQFRGSSNQRIIDVKKSLNQGEVVIWDKLNDGQTNYEQVDRKDML